MNRGRTGGNENVGVVTERVTTFVVGAVLKNK